jgi:hypothetical protein
MTKNIRKRSHATSKAPRRHKTKATSIWCGGLAGLKKRSLQRITKDGQIVEVRLAATALLNEAGDVYAISTTERMIRTDIAP